METTLKQYNPIGLQEMAEKSLLGRIDVKYIIDAKDVDFILQAAMTEFDVLEINGERNTAYETIYYDDEALDLYHHARVKRPNRFKLRYRQYKINGQEFFEIKKKIRGTSTLKERITLQDGVATCAAQITSFLEHHDIDYNKYRKSLQVLYNRICLVSKYNNERVTIDTNIMVHDFQNNYSFDGLSIIEIKSKKITSKNLITKALKVLGYQATSSSKYTLGMAYVDPTINKIGFAPQIRRINTILQNNLSK